MVPGPFQTRLVDLSGSSSHHPMPLQLLYLGAVEPSSGGKLHELPERGATMLSLCRSHFSETDADSPRLRRDVSLQDTSGTNHGGYVA